MLNKILFIRRDNIGDLICTTPAIHAVRKHCPNAKIGILVNSYNAEVVMNNPDIDEVYIYEKAKHVPEKNKLSVWLNNSKILIKIRKEKYDMAIACGSYSPRLARYTYMTQARIRIGYSPKNVNKSLFYNMSLKEAEKPMHEVERVFNLLSPLGIDGLPDKLRVFPSTTEIQRVREFLQRRRSLANARDDRLLSATSGIPFQNGELLIAFHISSRKPENRWSAEKFISLAELILKQKNAEIMLLWSPGSEKNPYHPGDDEKAELIIKAVPQIIPYKTNHLRELIAALSLANLVVCLDGGTMHIAAALEKPIVTIWGSTDPHRWRPWGVKHTILQGSDRKAENVNVETVFDAIKQFLKEITR
ncbi:glycosyltransferase family 9 protein [Thermodesulfovibrio sp. 3907-1M]|uniref:Lipopolysaccharide heptosyltransferase 3 n=1 Tax=Thermodesulfovibrio autotrophicus TaxID=3118333 RepID=A0AAU8GVT8_9BACT